METLEIEILNPKAKKLLKELENLDLISIKKNAKKGSFKQLLATLRSTDNPPTLAEITQEVEIVRSERYGKKAS